MPERCGNDRLQVIRRQPLLSLDLLVGVDLTAIRLSRDAMRRLPLGHELGIALGSV
jgi:hypothetical protein